MKFLDSENWHWLCSNSCTGIQAIFGAEEQQGGRSDVEGEAVHIAMAQQASAEGNYQHTVTYVL